MMKGLSKKLAVVLIGVLVLVSAGFLRAGSIDDRSFWKLREQALKRRQAAKEVPKLPGKGKAQTPTTEKKKSVIPDNYVPTTPTAPTLPGETATEEEGTSILPEEGPEEEIGEDVTQLPSLLPEDIRVASDYGSVSDVYNPGNPDQKLIIHIRDAHCHYEAQKNIARILEGLIKDYGANLVLLEGSSQDNSLVDLRSLNTRENREKVADRYLRQGLISGEEYLDIVSDFDFNPRGVEDFPLYKKHVQAYAGLEKIKDDSKTILGKVDISLTNLKSKVFNPELKEMDRDLALYTDGKLPLPQYCRYLESKARNKSIPFNKEFPNFNYFTQANRIEEIINFTQAEKERDKILAQLNQKLSKTALTDFNEQIDKYKRNELSSNQFYAYLKNTAEDTGVDLRAFPQFNIYVLYVKYSEEMDSIALFNEMKQLERRIKEQMYENEEQKRLDKVVGQVALLKGMVEFSLSPDDYTDWEKNRAEIKTYGWVNFIDSELAKYGFSGLDYKVSIQIQKYLPKYEEFYQLALERDKTLFENSLAEMDKDNQKVAVLIAGGFHTPRITKLMQEKGIAYTVVLPTITQEGNPDIYTSAMKLTMSALEEQK